MGATASKESFMETMLLLYWTCPWHKPLVMEDAPFEDPCLLSSRGFGGSGTWWFVAFASSTWHGAVADGFTKPLYGQAFQSFVNDFGMPRRVEDLEEVVPGASGASIAMALMTARTMLSGVDAREEESGFEFEAVWACGAVLMCLGAIYVGQLAFASA